MVTFPQPSSGETEMIDGCPVVSLHDSAADVEVFLRAIFDSSYFMPPPEPVNIQVLLGTLRFAHKYDVQYLYLRALKHLSARYGQTSADEYRTEDADSILFTGRSEVESHVTVITAATEVGALWLLPVAYYEVSSHADCWLQSAIEKGADVEIVKKCWVTQIHLSRGMSEVHKFLSVPSGAGCATSQKCDAIRFGQLESYFERRYEERDVNPLAECNPWSWTGHSGGDNFCSSCCTKGQMMHRTALNALWDRLPGIYGLPPWAELNALRKATMGDND
ncbi:BTB domain-containing protein [Mycena venus]|uniref:BTB domain-containing protein n=1 Tax=Mycena venus TaxID=2733690 RepID=A0A8H6U1G7_9AGAR|nr:BTB domain-containing protein [Mycena venus]